MKLTFVLAICLSFQALANVYSQTKITLQLNNVSLTKALELIEAKSDYYFVYSEQANLNKLTVNISSVNEPVPSVLNRMLLNSGFTFEPTTNNLIIIKPSGNQQQVLGVIYDENKVPIPGVSVKVKGASRTSITNAQGAFTIEANTGDVLVVSYIGYKTVEVPVTGNNITVNLELADQNLNEVVVVGYGTQLKKEVTNAVSQVRGSEIRKSSAPAISNALAGRVPGLIVNQRNGEPGRDEATLLVRGLGTTGNNSPLIVIDGVANRDGISRIDPNDVETISVLKDASASIYGAQAANGVILVTTRRGKTGKSQFNYSFNQGFVSPTRLVKMADASLYARTINDIDLQAGRTPTFNGTQLSNFANGTSPSTDWQAEVLKDYSVQNRHSLTMSGGSEKVKYFLSAGTSYQNGLQQRDETTKFKQYNFRTNIDAQASKRLTIGFDVAGRRENQNFLQQEQQVLYQSALLGDPTTPATINGLPTAGRQNNNPLAIAEGPGFDKTELNLINSTFRFKYDVPKLTGLFIDGFAAYDFTQTLRKVWAQPWTYYSQNNTGAVAPTVFGPNSLQQTYNRVQSLTLNAKINYAKTFGKHNLSAFLAYEQNEIRTDNFAASRANFASPLIDQLFAGNAGTQQNTGSAIESARQNYFGRVSYDYEKKYLFQAILRYDGSQIFPEGNRFGLFPGLSAGWVISEEAFMKDISWLSNLKLRASWSKLGNDRVDPFQFLNQFTYGSGYVFGGNTDVLVLNPGVAANPFITWEKQITQDIGLEAGFFRNKLTFEFDAFFNKRDDILGPRNITVPQYTGLLLPSENIQRVSNKGFDGTINYNGQIGKARYTVGGNFTYNKSNLKFADEGNIYQYDYQKAEGNPLGSPLIYNVIGIYQTAADIAAHPAQNTPRLGDYIYEDVNKDGIVTPDDRVRLPYSNIPQIQFGLNLSVSYQGFDLSALIQGQAKARQYMDYTVNLGTNGPDYFLANAWRPDATANPLARVGRSIALNSSFYQDVAFARLKNIELGYTIPQAVLNKVGVQALRVYVNGYNLFTVDGLKSKGLTDPENVNEKGWRYPLTKSINFGVNLTF
ncbi:SusC/RagA family TonB-linked outer membrane protein [Mucilaginibacter sp. PAMB04168]|uniref:SusC/RagA family TonB-linked outer membrane protein n=1 Tax=Mucilaginibacter sp. PAMB04168 TaxID=3138567 RepID=UPI0031F6A8F8